jgi:hypothetical protein
MRMPGSRAGMVVVLWAAGFAGPALAGPFVPAGDPPVALPGAVRFESSRRSTTFPIQVQSSLVFLPVFVNGTGPHDFVLDSGASRSLLERELARRIGLQVEGSGSVSGAGAGRVPVEFAPEVELGLPRLRSFGHKLSTIDLKPLEKVVGRRVDGILGYDVFDRFVVEVDYAARTVTLSSPVAWRYQGRGTSVPLEIEKNWPFVRAELTLPGEVTVQDRFLVDSGSADAVDHPLVAKLDSARPTTSGRGLGEAVPGFVGRATRFRIGGFELTDLPVACCGASEATSRLIGGEVLRRFRVIFDYSRKRMILERAQRVGDGAAAGEA